MDMESTPNPRLAYSTAEVAEQLGITEQHVRNLISRNAIHSIKLGRVRRIPTTEVERLLREGVPA